MAEHLLTPDWPAPGNVVAGTTLRAGGPELVPGNPVFLNQVHGAAVVEVGTFSEAPDADASVARRPGDVCVVRTADCLPVLLCARDGSEVAAAHAGWRGLAGGVLENTIAAMQARPDSLLAWLGPAISQASFEVGEDVRDAFVSAEPGAAACFAPNARGRWQADLYGLARRRLAERGVVAIYGEKWCTYGDSSRFHSYRRDPECGRMISFIHLK